MTPNCPKCGCPMTGGAPHGPWPIQYECRRCNVIVVPPAHDRLRAVQQKATDAVEGGAV